MSSANYLRVIRDVKCNQCEYEGTDIEFEEIEIINIGHNVFSSETYYECPKCKTRDDFTYLDEWGDPQIDDAIFLDDEDENYWEEDE